MLLLAVVHSTLLERLPDSVLHSDFGLDTMWCRWPPSCLPVVLTLPHVSLYLPCNSLVDHLVHGCDGRTLVGPVWLTDHPVALDELPVFERVG